MLNCFIARIFGCKGQTISEYMPHLTKAVNKLRSAVGDPVEECEYSYDDIVNVRDALQNAIRSVQIVAKRVDGDRLEGIANAEAVERAEKELEAVKQKLAQAEQRNSELQSIIDEAQTKTESEYKGLAVSMIKFRDQLLYFRDEFNKDGNEQAVTLLRNLYKETGRFMSVNGVESLEETGEFDAERHMAVDTKTTDDPSQNNIIAEIFRPGYRIAGESYRPQEVIIYVYKS